MQFLFEDYVLDLDRRELTRGSKAIAAGPQVFDLLVCLIQALVFCTLTMVYISMAIEHEHDDHH